MIDMDSYTDVSSVQDPRRKDLAYSYALSDCPTVDIWDDFKRGDEVVAIKHHGTCDPDELPVVRGELLTFMVQHGDQYCRVKNCDGRIGFLPLSHIGPKEYFYEEPWYYEVCSSKIAEAIVNAKIPGSFIAWNDSEQQQNTVTLTVKTETCVEHFRFKKKGCKLMFGDRIYQSIFHAIHEFRNEGILKNGVGVSLPDVTVSNNHPAIRDSLILTGTNLVAKDDFRWKKKISHIVKLKSGHKYSLIGTLPDHKWYVVKDLVVGLEGFAPAVSLVPLYPRWFHGEMSVPEIKNKLFSSQQTCSFLVAKTSGILNHRMPYILGILDPQSQIQLLEIEYKNERVSCFNSVQESILDLINGFLTKKNVPMLRYAITDNGVDSLRSDLSGMDMKSLITYFQALEEGCEKDYNIRLMLLGHFGVGKTTIARRLLQIQSESIKSTEGIEVAAQKARIDIQTGEWILEGIENEQDLFDERLVHVVRENSKCDTKDEETEVKVVDDYATIDTIHISEEESSDKVCDVQIRKRKTKKSDEVLSMPRRRISSESDAFIQKRNESEHVFRHSLKDLSPSKRNRITRIVKRSSKEGTQHGFISVWDFAGQYIYYATHQVFMSYNAIYLLVLDLSKSLDDVVQVNDHPAGGAVEQPSRRIKDFIEIWMQSVHTRKDGEVGELPPVILVGTHRDKLPCSQEEIEDYIKKYFESVRRLFDDSPLINHIQPEQICLNSIAETDILISELKRILFQVTNRMPWWGCLKPAKWINLEQMLLSMAKKSPVAYVNDIQTANKKLPVPINDEDEVRTCLRTLHNYGRLLYFEDVGLGDTVILRPQWIIDAFKSFVLSLDEARRNPDLRACVDDVRNGILHEVFINRLWEQNEYAQFREHKDIILLYLKRLCILAKGCTAAGAEEFYFVPSLIQDCEIENELEVSLSDLSDSNTSVPVKHPALFIKIDSANYHPSLLSSLLADCLGRWRVANQNNVYRLNSRGGLFVLDKSKTHIMSIALKFLQKNAFYIECKVMNVANGRVDQRKSDEVRRFIVSALMSHMHLSDASSLELLIQCTHPDVVNVLGSLTPCETLDTYATVGCHGHCTAFTKTTIDSEKLLSFWFPNGYKKDDYSSLKQWIDDAPEYVNDQSLTDRHFERLAMALGFGWEHVGISLGISPTEMDQLKLDYPQRTYMQIYAMFKRWKKKSKKRVTFLMFVKALFDNERVHVDWDIVKNVGEGVYT